MVETLRRQGYHRTPQRLALLKLSAESDSHPSANELLWTMGESFPTTSAATVYKTLAVLKDLGEVDEIGFSDDDNRYDVNRPAPHTHNVRVRCHAVMDAEANELDEVSKRLAASHDAYGGFRIISHRVDLLGACPQSEHHEAAAEGKSTTGDGTLCRRHSQAAGGQTAAARPQHER